MHDDEQTSCGDEDKLNNEWMALEQEQQELMSDIQDIFAKAAKDRERLKDEFLQAAQEIVEPSFTNLSEISRIVKTDVSVS